MLAGGIDNGGRGRKMREIAETCGVEAKGFDLGKFHKIPEKIHNLRQKFPGAASSGINLCFPFSAISPKIISKFFVFFQFPVFFLPSVLSDFPVTNWISRIFEVQLQQKFLETLFLD